MLYSQAKMQVLFQCYQSTSNYFQKNHSYDFIGAHTLNLLFKVFFTPWTLSEITRIKNQIKLNVFL